MPRLKNQGIFKVFFSSPFGGMEEEREELTRRYFPQIRHLCSRNGVQFAAVDMRWGITSESSENAQVINICLREIDRSDMFMGFFGQRYGWHGADDNILQDNFNNAVGRYAWLEQFRDKSVTELEFLHGYLNDPGHLPAAMFFRDKSYDDKLCEEGKQKGDKKQVYKYSAESEQSIELMEDLKARVLHKKEKSMGVYMDYKTPAKAAEIMFQIIMKHLKETLLADLEIEKRTKREEILSQHDAFLTSRCSIFVNKEKYLKALNDKPMQTNCDSILVTGEPGSGKSAALCNWIASLKFQKSSYAVAYHFVGFAENSTAVNQILARLVDEFEYLLYQDDRPMPEERSETSEPGSMEETKYFIHKLLSVLQKVVATGKTPVIVIDGLDKVTGTSKITKILYWLPSEFPEGCTVAVSTLTPDISNIEELKRRKYRTVHVEPLQEDAKRELCVQILEESSKELSPHQLDKIVSAEMTKLPIFLRVTLSELVSFGYFRFLDKKIADLIASHSTEELFGKVLSRLEEDYNVPEDTDDVVEQVLCSIYLSSQGLKELEIKEIFDIPDHIWSPLYFAIEKLTINQSGCIQFAFNELKHACSLRYLSDPKKKNVYLKKLIDFFGKEVNKVDGFPSAEETCPRPVLELPKLWLELGDMEGLADCLSNFHVFNNLQRHTSYDLVSLWRDTGYTGHTITDKLLLTFDTAISVLYTEAEEKGLLESTSVPGLKIDWFLRSINSFLTTASFHDCREKVILRDINLLTDLLELPKCQSSKGQIHATLRELRYQLACLYSQMDKTAEKGIQLHHKLLEILLRHGEEHGMSDDLYQEIGTAYHGISVGYSSMFNFEKMIEFSEKAIDCYKQMEKTGHVMGSAWNNLGVGHMWSGNLEQALECYNKSIKAYEEQFFGETPPVIGEIINNKALCYRKLDRLEEAEETYIKSLEVKQKAFGTEHHIVAMSYLNLGTLEMYRKNYQKSKEYNRKAREVYEVLDQTWTNPEYVQCWENELAAMATMEQFVEVDEHIMKILQWRIDDGSMDRSLSSLFREMLVYYVREKVHFERAVTMAKALLMSVRKDDMPVYIFLDMALQNLPEDYRSDVPEEMTLKYIVERNPGSIETLAYYVETYLIPAVDLDQLALCINRLHDAIENPSESVYIQTLNWCPPDDNVNHIRCQQRISEEGLKRYPASLEINLNLAKCFRRQDRSDLALPYAIQVADQQMDNHMLVYFTAHTAALANKLNTSRHYAEHIVKTSDDENVKSMAKALIEMIDNGEKSQNEETSTNQDGKNTEATDKDSPPVDGNSVDNC